jgi:signal recognition particle subunit SRP54
MFEALSERIVGSFKKLRGKKITEANIEESIKEIRQSLLEADVNFKVVKTFIDRVKEKALGQQVLQGVEPGQQFVKIVHDELVEILGKETKGLELKSKPSLIMMVGLQGTGKTTTSGKLAKHITQKMEKKVGLVPADIYRPAAIDQLKQLGEQAGVPVYPTEAGQKPTDIAKKAKKWAEDLQLEVVILDTAGRLQIDDALMTELQDITRVWAPDETLLVADAMLGQQSVNVAQGFHERLKLTGLVLTKVDGDARGGAALSIREATGIPIKFLGVGEKQSALEIFHPDRLAGRILDMGDVLTLVERAQEVVDQAEAEAQAQKLLKNEFTVEDFLKQIRQIKKLGPLEGLLKMMPGMGQAMKELKNVAPPDEEIRKIEAIINSMTPSERRDHRIISGSRSVRIAKGSGTRIQDVNKFLKQFETTKRAMSQLMTMGAGGGGGFPGLKLPF